MARADYGLQIFKTVPLESANGTTYTATIWIAGSGSSGDWKLASNGLKLDWESADVQDKNSPILASKLTLDVMVEDLTQENNVKSFSERAEKYAWVTLRRGSAGSMLWAGYLIPNLDTKEDVAYPYISTLVFVDGIASLKEKPFIRETNTETSAVPTFPYVKADTWATAGYDKIIGSGDSWIKRILDEVGMLLDSDEDVPGAGLENYVIQTAVNWWNEDMDGGPDSATCPFTLIKINVKDFYSVNENNKYTAPTVYDVLKNMCKSFNMRMFYWEHTFHFIQISEYNTDEEGAAPYATPINIPTREFYYNGNFKTSRDYFGTTTYSLYNQVIETGTTNSGLQKLATTQYEALSAIKRTKTTYAEFAGGNYFNGFPLFLTHNTVSGLPTTWPTDGVMYQYTQFSQSGQVYNIMNFTDADQLAGFLCRIYLSFDSTSSKEINMCCLWTIRAKPAGSAWGAADNKTLYKHTGSPGSGYTDLRWMDDEFPLLNNQQYIRQTIGVPANCTDYVINIFDSSTSPNTDVTDNLIPTHADFTGSWDFQFYTFTEFDSNRTKPMYAYVQGNSGYSHGFIYSAGLGGGVNHVGTSLVAGMKPPFYGLDYVDTISTISNGGAFFQSIFSPVKSGAISFGETSQEIQVEQSGNDSYEYDVGLIAFGDGSGADTNSTYQVYDGSDWVYVNPLGKWAKGIYTWSGSAYVWSALTYDKKSQVLIGEEIMNNQSNTILTFSGTTALSSVNKYFSGSTKLKFMNPCARMEDSDGNKYMMMRSSFNLINDEWNGQWVQVYYDVPTTVTDGVGATTTSQQNEINQSTYNV